MTLRTLDELREIGHQPFHQNRYISLSKARGQKIVGWLCNYIPEELIEAAGMLPIRILGDSGVAIQEADAYLYANTCFFARSCLELGLQNRYDFLDLFVAGNTCDPIRRLFDVWRHYLPVPAAHLIPIPHRISNRAYIYFADQLRSFKGILEDLTGFSLSPDKLRGAIGLYNRTRDLLKELYELQRSERPRIRGSEMMQIIRAAWRMPRTEYNQALERLLEELKGRPPLPKGRARLLMAGSLLDRQELLQLIEDLGGWVISDELCTGTRYFCLKVDTRLEPLEALARRYLDKPPCARMRPYSRRLEYIRQLIDTFRIDGVIHENIKFCELYGQDKPLIREDLQRWNIPVLELDLEYGVRGIGQLRTRIEAFLEMLETAKAGR